MRWFVLKKKWIWALGVLLSMYVMLIPYQKNLLLFFENPETAETPKLHIMWRKQICFVLGAVFLAWQVLAIPGYVWYLSVYPRAVGKLLLLIFTQFVSASIFYGVSVVSRKTIAGFIVVLIAILLIL